MPKTAEQKAEQYRKELDQFARIISHDISAPVRSITGNIDLLERKLDNNIGDDERTLLANIKRGKERYMAMMQAINDYAKFSLRHTPSSEAFSAAKLVEDAKTALIKKLIAHDAEVDLNPDALPLINGDEKQLYFVFWELIDNAIKYRDKDRKLNIKISCESNDEEHIFCVEDNAIGIEERFYEKTFQIFRKLHHEKDFPGMGVGLAYLQRIIDTHGGECWIESESGKGSKFFFTLPI